MFDHKPQLFDGDKGFIWCIDDNFFLNFRFFVFKIRLKIDETSVEEEEIGC
jgi:hypothetical protein